MTEETGELAGDQVDDAERFEPPDGPTILRAYCQAQLVELPRGGRGTRAAIDLLTAIPKCARLGWADMTVSAPELFRMLEHAELLKSRPAASDMSAALRLVASVCSLVTQKSARRWSVWFSRACDPDHALGASIRETVTPAMLHRPPSTTPSESRRRTASIRAERDRLAIELDTLKEDLNALRATHDHTETELASARERATKAEREFADLQGKRAKSRQERTKATLALAKSEAKAKVLQQHNEQTQRTLKGLDREKSNLERELRSARAKLSERDKRLATLASEKDALKDQLDKRELQLGKREAAEIKRLKVSSELTEEKKHSAELRWTLSKLGRTLGLGDFVQEESWAFQKSAEEKILCLDGENQDLREQTARFIDISALELAEAQYRGVKFSEGLESGQIDEMIERPSERQTIRESARRAAQEAREAFEGNTGIELPARPSFWEG